MPLSHLHLCLGNLNVHLFCKYFLTCLFMFKFIYHKQNLPDTFHIFFFYHQTFILIQQDVLRIFTYCRTTNHQFFIKFRGPHLWNSLNPTLKSSPSLTTFKSDLTKCLLSNSLFSNWVHTPHAHLKYLNFCPDYSVLLSFIDCFVSCFCFVFFVFVFSPIRLRTIVQALWASFLSCTVH